MRTLTQTRRVQLHAARARHLFSRRDRARLGRLFRDARLAASRPARRQPRVRGEFSQQDVVNSEQPDADIGGDLGEAGLRRRRARARRQPAHARQPASVDELRALAAPRTAVRRRTTPTSVSTSRSPARRSTTTSTDCRAGLVTRVNERSSLTTRVRGARYDIDTQDVDRCAMAPSSSGARARPPRRARYLRAGAQNVELQSGDSEIAWLAGAGVSLMLGRNELFADLVAQRRRRHRPGS